MHAVLENRKAIASAGQSLLRGVRSISNPMFTSKSAAFALLSTLAIAGCGESKKAEAEPEPAPAKTVQSAAPVKAPVADNMATVSKAQLRALCILPTLSGTSASSGGVDIVELGTTSASKKSVPAILIDSSMGSIPTDYATPDVYFSALAFSAMRSEPPFSVCSSVREYPDATLLAILLRDTKNTSKKGYWGYTDLLAAGHTMNDKGVFLGDVEESVARAKLVDLLQQSATKHLSATLKTLSPIDSRWAEAFQNAAQ